MNKVKTVDAYVWYVAEDNFILESGKFVGTEGKLITFKDIDTNKEYKLNLPMKYENAQQWLRDCKKGNIIHGMTINMYGTVAWWLSYKKVTVKEVNNNDKAEDNAKN